jgi:excisionase family DNA binding protein
MAKETGINGIKPASERPYVRAPQLARTTGRQGGAQRARASSEKSEEVRTRLLTLREVAQYLRVHPGTVYRLVRTGELPAARVGRDLRFDIQVVDQWVASGGSSAWTSRKHRH